LKNHRLNIGLKVSGSYFIFQSLVSAFIFMAQAVFSPVLILIIILGLAAGVGVLLKRKVGFYIALVSAPIVLTSFLSSALYSLNMLRGVEDAAFFAHQFGLILLGLIWPIMCFILIDNREEFNKGSR